MNDCWLTLTMTVEPRLKIGWSCVKGSFATKPWSACAASDAKRAQRARMDWRIGLMDVSPTPGGAGLRGYIRNWGGKPDRGAANAGTVPVDARRCRFLFSLRDDQ